LHVGKIIQENSRQRLHPQIFVAADGLRAQHLPPGSFLERPADERREAVGAILQVTQHTQMFDTVLRYFSEWTEHHGG